MEDAVELIWEVLRLNPITLETKTTKPFWVIALDNIMVVYWEQEGKNEVVKVIWTEPRIHTQDWLDRVSDLMNFDTL
jgi:hypothetical protein